ncbi:MAG TPA: hypothetical protein VG123_29450 [Streptosporangiaceae bacterium]|nr:hypothetical protein [Streptosporangiaceae bacterium]
MTFTCQPAGNGGDVQVLPGARVPATYAAATGATGGPRCRALTRSPRSPRVLRGTAAMVAVFSVGVLAVSAPVAQASQRPAARVAASYPYKFSRIAWTGSKAVIAAADSHGDLYYFWQAPGSTTWHRQLVAAATSHLAYSKPSPIAELNGTLYFAAVDGAGDLYYFSKTGTAKWSQVLLGSGGATRYQAPSATAGDADVLISASNTGGDLVTFTHFVYGGTTWTEQTAATGLFGPSSVSTGYDAKDSQYLGLLTAASGGTLYFFWEYLAAPGWNQQTVAVPSSAGHAGPAGGYAGGSVAASNTGIVITAAAAAGGAVAAFTQPIGGTTWTRQPVAISGSYTSPQIAWTGTVNGVSYDVITAASHGGALHYWWKADESSGNWTPETVAANGTNAVYASPGIAITSTSVVITAINTKPGNLMYWSQAFASTAWHKEVVATG